MAYQQATQAKMLAALDHAMAVGIPMADYVAPSVTAARPVKAPEPQCVWVGGREYTVSFGDDGHPSCVQVHVKSHGYCIALRRLPLNGDIARAAIAKATA